MKALRIFKEQVELTRFFLPLGVTAMAMSVSHAIIDSGLSRMPRPETALAAFAVAKSFAIVIQNPMTMVRQTIVSLVQDQYTYGLITRFLTGLIALIVTILATVAYTGLGDPILRTIFSLQGDILVNVKQSLGILVFLPLATILRNVSQGMAILSKRTGLVPMATAVRLLALAAILPALIHTELPGAVVGALIFVGTLSTEGIAMFLGARPGTKRLPKKRRTDLALPDIWRFFRPLMLTTLLMTATLPVLNALMARGLDAERQIAAFAVAWNLFIFMVSPVMMLQQVPLVFTREGRPRSYAKVRWFMLAVGVTLTAIVLVAGYTPVGFFVLKQWIQVPQSLAHTAVGVLRLMILVPAVRVWREYQWGILLRMRHTEKMGKARIAAVAVIVSAMVVGLRIAPEHMAYVSAFAILASESVECLVLVVGLHHLISGEFRAAGVAASR